MAEVLVPSMIVHGEYRTGSLVFPGSFNPLHAGHVAMAEIAMRLYNHTVQPEISIANVDKPELADDELNFRLTQVRHLGQPLVTRAALFADKSDLFPGCRFVVGADTAMRLGDPAYAGGRADAHHQMLDRIASNGCRFLVFGRLVDGQFRDADSLRLPSALHELCDFVGATTFRCDISSTQLRQRSVD